MADIRLSDEFKGKAGKLWSDIKTILPSGDTKWREDLKFALKMLEGELNDNQRKAISGHASATFLQDLNKGDLPLSNLLTHSFKDPIIKNAEADFLIQRNLLSNMQILTMLLSLKEVMQDNMHNYPLLLGEELPQTVRNILTQYEDSIIPQINTMIEELSNDSSINPDDITIDTLTGNEHLGRLPEDVFTNINI